MGLPFTPHASSVFYARNCGADKRGAQTPPPHDITPVWLCPPCRDPIFTGSRRPTALLPE